ncbi:MAG: hypothetical protein ACI4VC_04795 [Clostridia bacterium]
MNLNKCERCGCFFASKSSVCPNCESKDENDINQLKNFLNESDTSVTVESLAFSTGISLKNVNRLLKDKDLYTTLTNLGLNSQDNINSNTKISL